MRARSGVRRRGAFAVFKGAQEYAFGIAQAQRPHAAEVVNSRQVVKLGQRRKVRVVLAFLGMGARNNAPPPGIGRGVCQREVKDRIRFGRRAPRLESGHQWQVRRDLKPARACQPLGVIGEGGKLALPLLCVAKVSGQHTGLAHADIHTLNACGRLHRATPGVLLALMRLGNCASINTRPIWSWPVSSNCDKRSMSPNT